MTDVESTGVFEDTVFVSNYSNSSSVITLIDLENSYGHAYPLVHVCLPRNAALIMSLIMGMLFLQVTCIGIFYTSDKAIKSIFNHFQLYEKARPIDDKSRELESIRTKLAEKRKQKEQSQQKGIKNSNIELTVCNDVPNKSLIDLEKEIEDVITHVINQDTADECEDQTILRKYMSGIQLATIAKIRGGTIIDTLYQQGIKASATVIQRKIRRLTDKNHATSYKHKQTLNVNDIDYNFVDGKIQLQVEEQVVSQHQINLNTLTDYQTELVQKWLQFIKFSKVLVLILVLRVVFRVGLICWLFLWSVINVDDAQDQSIWDAFFTNLIMSPIAWSVWRVDYAILINLVNEYNLVEPMNRIINRNHFLFAPTVSSRNIRNMADELNPFAINCCKCMGCHKSYVLLKWHSLMSCFICIVITVAASNLIASIIDVMMAVIWCLGVILMWGVVPFMIGKGGPTTACRGCHLILLAGGCASHNLLWISVLYTGIKHDQICANDDISDSWSHGVEKLYLMLWVLM